MSVRSFNWLGGTLPRSAAWLAGAMSIVAVAIAGITALDTREAALVEQTSSVDRMLAQLPPGSDMISLGAPQPMVLSGQTNPDPYLTRFPAVMLQLERRWPGGLAGFVDHLAADPPEIIAFRWTPLDESGGPYEKLTRWIAANYTARGSRTGMGLAGSSSHRIAGRGG